MAGSLMLKGMSEDECLLVARLVKHGLPCFAIYSHGDDASPQEEKEVLDYFAGVFTVLDSRCADSDPTLTLSPLPTISLGVFSLYDSGNQQGEKEVQDYFAGVFTVLDSRCEYSDPTLTLTRKQRRKY